MTSRDLIAGSVVFCALLGAQSQAAVTVYTDRATFLNDVAMLSGTSVLNEDFNSFGADTSFHDAPLALNGFTATGFGAPTSTINLIDVGPFASAGKQDIDGTPYLRGHHVETTRYYQLDFPTPALAWGADIADVEQLGTNLRLAGGMTIDLANTGASGLQFIGVISDTPFESLRAVGGGGGGDAVGIDNVVTVVPSPSGLAIVTFGGLALIRRRR